MALSLAAVTAVSTARSSEAATSTITFRSATSAANGFNASLVIPAPVGAGAGDVLVAVVAARHACAAVPPLGWTHVRTDTSSDPTRPEQSIFVHADGASEPAAYRWTFSAPCGAVGSILAFAGVDTTAPVDGSSGRSVTSATRLTAPSLATTVDGAMLVAGFGIGGSRVVTSPIGMTEDTLQILSDPPGEKVTGETASALVSTAGPTGPISADLNLAGAGIAQLVALRPAQRSPMDTLTEYGLTAGLRPSSIARGPGGDIWFTLHTSLAHIGSATGAVDYLSLPTPGSLGGLTAAPDGNIWFTESTLNRIARIEPTGTVTEFPIPTAASAPAGIVLGADGNLWVAEVSANKIARVGLDGKITEFRVPTAGAQPHGISLGPDGNVWFAELAANKIARITPTGVVTEYPVPTAASKPFVVTAGPDGNVWFTEQQANKIGRITPTGTVTEFSLPTPNAGVAGITAGPDGNVWFTEKQANKIGRITPAGAIREWALPNPGADPNKITAGADGNLWFTEQGAAAIGRITP